MDQGDAQSLGSCYDQGQEPNKETVAILDATQPGEPSGIDAVLASDGWYWRVTSAWKYGLK